MKSNDFKSRLLISDTQIPDLFMVRYAPFLSKEAVCLYLFLQMHSNSAEDTKFSIESISAWLPFDEADAKNAIAELIGNSLLDKDDNDKYYLADIKLREIDDYCALKAATPYGVDSVAAGLSGNEAAQALISSINETFYNGKMSGINFRLIDRCLNEYKFDTMVIYRLFEEGKLGRIQYDISKMERLAGQWAAKGVKTTEDLTEIIEVNRKIKSMTKLMGKLTKRRLNGIDIEYVEDWVRNLGVSEEMADLAFRKNEYKGTITLGDVDTKLKLWQAVGADTLEKAVKYEEEQQTLNKKAYKRTKGKSGGIWKTGKEAGILDDMKISDNEIDEKSKDVEVKHEDDDDQLRDVLNMFGGADENN